MKSTLVQQLHDIVGEVVLHCREASHYGGLKRAYWLGETNGGTHFWIGPYLWSSAMNEYIFSNFHRS